VGLEHSIQAEEQHAAVEFERESEVLSGFENSCPNITVNG